MVIVLSKTDLRPVSELRPEEKEMIESMRKEFDALVLDISNVDGTGVFKVKSQACDIL